MPKTKERKRFPKISLRREMELSRKEDLKAVKALRKEVAKLLEKEKPSKLGGPWRTKGRRIVHTREVLPRRHEKNSYSQYPRHRYIDTNGTLHWAPAGGLGGPPLPELPLEMVHWSDLMYWRIDLEKLAKRLRKL